MCSKNDRGGLSMAPNAQSTLENSCSRSELAAAAADDTSSAESGCPSRAKAQRAFARLLGSYSRRATTCATPVSRAGAALRTFACAHNNELVALGEGKGRHEFDSNAAAAPQSGFAESPCSASAQSDAESSGSGRSLRASSACNVIGTVLRTRAAAHNRFARHWVPTLAGSSASSRVQPKAKALSCRKVPKAHNTRAMSTPFNAARCSSTLGLANSTASSGSPTAAERSWAAAQRRFERSGADGRSDPPWRNILTRRSRSNIVALVKAEAIRPMSRKDSHCSVGANCRNNRPNSFRPSPPQRCASCATPSARRPRNAGGRAARASTDADKSSSGRRSGYTTAGPVTAARRARAATRRAAASMPGQTAQQSGPQREARSAPGGHPSSRSHHEQCCGTRSLAS
mmetsp:Transcript_179305/g.568939  ORF Transcript_179305/g.568939 Transcript_179305/m.568939 type:complete len:401 (+) Transcript_179305:1525-2727(+)